MGKGHDKKKFRKLILNLAPEIDSAKHLSAHDAPKRVYVCYPKCIPCEVVGWMDEDKLYMYDINNRVDILGKMRYKKQPDIHKKCYKELQ